MPLKSIVRPLATTTLLLLLTLEVGEAMAEGDGLFSESDPNQYALEVGGEIFRWQETDDNGKRLLTEQGPRVFVGGSIHNLIRRDAGVVYLARIRAFGGEVEYDGQDTDGTYVSTSTQYSGWDGEGRVGYRFAGGEAVYAVDAMAGIGTERWRRDIQSARNALGFPVARFVEEYAVDYARVFLGLAHRLNNSDSYLSIGARLPLAISEDLTYSGTPIELKPGKRASGFISYKVSIGDTQRGEPFGSYLEVYYTGLRFDKSPTRTVHDNTLDQDVLVWQPDSAMDVVGVTFGFSY